MLQLAYIKLATFAGVFIVTAYVYVLRTSSSHLLPLYYTFKSSPEEKCRSQKNMIQFCSVELCINPFKTFNWNAMMNYAPKYGLANCAIPKSLSTVSMAIFCYLYDADTFVAENRTLPDEKWIDRLCNKKNEAHKPDPEQLHAKNWTHLVVVRHPVDRFLSGFVDKCVNARVKNSTALLAEKTKSWCHGCGTDIACFLEEHYKKLSVHGDQHYSMPMEEHFYPQNWYCGFHSHINDYKIIKYPTNPKKMEHFFDEMGSLFLLHGVPKDMVHTISDQLMNKKTHHATSGLTSTALYRKKLLRDKELLKLLVKIYYYDFVLFGFDFPQI